MSVRRRSAIAVAVAAVALGAGVALWEGLLEDRLVPKRWGVVEAGKVFRSGQLHPALVERVLKANDIDVIVDLDPDDTPAARAEDDAARQLGIEQDLFPLIGDGTGDIEQYAQAIARVAEARRHGDRVLVHCSAGTYRTGGVVAAYRMLVEGWPAEAARDEMLRYKWDPRNPLLPRYLNEHMPTLARRLVELGVIERAPEPLPRLPE